jgi:phytoene/squalene synthetase
MSASSVNEIEFDFPEIPYSTIPCIERLLEYCDALEAVATCEIDGMSEDARQSMVDLLSELRGYILEVATAEIEEICDRQH